MSGVVWVIVIDLFAAAAIIGLGIAAWRQDAELPDDAE